MDKTLKICLNFLICKGIISFTNYTPPNSQDSYEDQIEWYLVKTTPKILNECTFSPEIKPSSLSLISFHPLVIIHPYCIITLFYFISSSDNIQNSNLLRL